MKCPQYDVPESFIVLCFLICLVYFVAIYIFTKCRKIAYNVKFWLLHVLVTNLLVGVFIGIAAVFIIVVNKDTDSLIIRCCNACARFGGQTGLLMMSAMGIDRLLSLQFNIRYHLYVTRRRIKIYAFIMYVLGCLSVLASFIGEQNSCHFFRSLNTTLYQGWVSVIIFSIFTTLNVFVYAFVGIVAHQKRRTRASNTNFRRNDYSRFFKLTLKSFSFVLLYLFLMLPVSVYQFFLLAADDGSFQLPATAHRLISRLTLIFFIMLPCVFVANYKESRYRFLRLMCFCNIRYKDKLVTEFKQRYASYEIYTVKNRMSTEV